MRPDVPASPRRWCSSSRPPHPRIDQRVGVALEKPMPNSPTTLLTRGLADSLDQDILAQQPPLLSKAISLVVIQPGICLCNCGPHRPIPFCVAAVSTCGVAMDPRNGARSDPSMADRHRRRPTILVRQGQASASKPPRPPRPSRPRLPRRPWPWRRLRPSPSHS